MFAIIAAVVSIVSAVSSYLQMRKGRKSSITAGEFETTSSDEGNSIPVIFGTCDVAPNVTAFLAGTPQAIKK